jgi:mannitol/fructose-specific phosphotransferase system IIA component (Ntr-type)
MFLAWGIISSIYLLVIFTTIGLSNPLDLSTSLTPISLGADGIPFLAGVGGMIMAIAAILAFISTANAGILAASRDPMAMGKDQLIPEPFSKISKRGTPTFSILFTSSFMILVILFLDIESLVKTASLLKILLFIFVIISLIIMRESKIRHYHPKFKSPFYPWIQIGGIFGLVFLIFEMGFIPMLIVGFFILFGFLWYWFYARDKIWREYSLLHIVERIKGEKSTSYMVDEELREILIDRDNITEKRFEELIKKSEVIDIDKLLHPDELAHLISNKLSEKLNINEDKLYKILRKKERDSNIIIHPGVAILSHTIKGRDKFEILFIRSKKGLLISDNVDPIYAFVIIVASSDLKNFYNHSLMWIVQIADKIDFKDEWINAKDKEIIKDIILTSWKQRKTF